MLKSVEESSCIGKERYNFGGPFEIFNFRFEKTELRPCVQGVKMAGFDTFSSLPVTYDDMPVNEPITMYMVIDFINRSLINVGYIIDIFKEGFNDVNKSIRLGYDDDDIFIDNYRSCYRKWTLFQIVGEYRYPVCTFAIDMYPFLFDYDAFAIMVRFTNIGLYVNGFCKSEVAMFRSNGTLRDHVKNVFKPIDDNILDRTYCCIRAHSVVSVWARVSNFILLPYLIDFSFLPFTSSWNNLNPTFKEFDVNLSYHYTSCEVIQHDDYAYRYYMFLRQSPEVLRQVVACLSFPKCLTIQMIVDYLHTYTYCGMGYIYNKLVKYIEVNGLSRSFTFDEIMNHELEFEYFVNGREVFDKQYFSLNVFVLSTFLSLRDYCEPHYDARDIKNKDVLFYLTVLYRIEAFDSWNYMHDDVCTYYLTNCQYEN